MSEAQISPANPILCPRCGQALNVADNQTDVTCGCGFQAFAPYVNEANYLRAGLPKWQARLSELEDAINLGLRPAGTETGQLDAAKKPAMGAYQYLVGGGAVLLFAGLTAFVGIMWRYLGLLGQGSVLVIVTAILVVLANRLATRIQSTATALSVLAVGSWLIDSGWVINHVVDQLSPTSRVVTTFMIPALVSVLTALVFVFIGKRFANEIWHTVGTLFIPISIGLVLISAELNIAESTEVSSVLWAALALPLSVSILMLLDGTGVTKRMFTGVSHTLALVVFSLLDFGFLGASLQVDKRAALAWATHLVVLAGYSYLHANIRALTAPLVAAAVALSAGFVDLPVVVRLAFPILLSLISLRTNKNARIQPVLIISATSAVWLMLGFAQVKQAEFLPCAIALAVVTGAVVMIHAWTLKRSEYVPLGAIFLALAIIFANMHLNITFLEAFTFPIAALFLISGLFAHRINSGWSSMYWLAPGCSVAVLPSTVRAAESLEYSTRFTLSLIASILLLIVGARLRYLGMLATGLVAAVLSSRLPLGMLFSAVQPWILFTLSGVLLLLLGARFEHLRKRAGAAKAWIAGSLR